jgi:hypothetical protein
MPGLGIGWEQLMNTGAPGQTTNGATLSGSTALTDVSPVDYEVPAYSVLQGQVYQVTAAGILTTAASTPGTLTLAFYYGGIGGTLVCSTGALSLYTSATNATWQLQIYSRIHTVSNASVAAVYPFGTVTGITSATGTSMMPATAASGGPVNLTTNVNAAFCLGATFSSSTTNTLTVYQFLVESLN